MTPIELKKEAEDKLYSFPTRAKYQQLEICLDFIDRSHNQAIDQCIEVAKKTGNNIGLSESVTADIIAQALEKLKI